MKHPKHTPGPWTVETYHDSMFRIVKDLTGDVYEVPTSCTKANARLIAAAPEMLGILEHLESCNGEVSLDVMTLISQVLGKARGES